jgi:hypothetical protein
VKRNTGGQRLRRLVDFGGLVTGLGMVAIIGSSLLTGNAGPGMRSEAWIELGIGVFLISLTAFDLVRPRR